MIDNNKKYKLVKLRKTLIALGIAITIPISGLTIFTAKSINHFLLIIVLRVLMEEIHLQLVGTWILIMII